MNGLRRLFIVLMFGLGIGVHPLADQQSTAPLLPLSEAILTKLPQDWREPAQRIKASEQEQQRLLKLTDAVLRQNIARILIRSDSADSFVKSQLTKDPSPAVRTVIVQAIAADSRWNALPDTVTVIENVVVRDPDPAVSMTALEILRRSKLRQLNMLLNERIASAATRGDDPAAMTRLIDAQERWVMLERGTMLPAFLRVPPAAFSLKPTDTPVRVLAFGDFGNGSAEQKMVAQTIGSYHQQHPFDFALTLGDNFYSIGMESPADPRWHTWFEDLYGPLGIAFYASFGNHDWGHPDSPAAEILYSGKTPTWRMPAAYYTFTAGPVQFFALDTQTVALAKKQLDWLDRELSNRRARWKVVYGHHPIYSDGNYEDRPDLIASLLPILAERADVYICGHDHNLQALQPQRGVHFYIAGGGGAGLYDVTPSPRSLFVSRSNGFAVLEAENGRLTVRLVDSTGKTVYEEALSKPQTTTALPQSPKQ
jgi:tartrate-resistant acid phosphatase type 5